MCHKLGIEHLGGDRRRGHQAVRLHALLPGPGPRRSLHPDRSAVPVVEAARRSSTRRASSSWPTTSTRTCRTWWSRRRQDALNEQKKALNGVEGARSSAWPTRKTSTTCASRRRSTSSSCLQQKGAERQLPRPLRARRCASASTTLKSVSLDEARQLRHRRHRHRPHQRRLQDGGAEGQGRARHAQRPQEPQGRRPRQTHLALFFCARPQLRSIGACGRVRLRFFRHRQ